MLYYTAQDILVREDFHISRIRPKREKEGKDLVIENLYYTKNLSILSSSGLYIFPHDILYIC